MKYENWSNFVRIVEPLRVKNRIKIPIKIVYRSNELEEISATEWSTNGLAIFVYKTYTGEMPCGLRISYRKIKSITSLDSRRL